MVNVGKMAIALREITKENLSDILKLKVANYQEKFVASNAVSIAQAHFSPEIAWFRAIYADEVPVGFLMLDDEPNNASYYLWRLMIDERFQKRGFGKRALELLIEHVKTRPGGTALLTSCENLPIMPGIERFSIEIGSVNLRFGDRKDRGLNYRDHLQVQRARPSCPYIDFRFS